MEGKKKKRVSKVLVLCRSYKVPTRENLFFFKATSRLPYNPQYGCTT